MGNVRNPLAMDYVYTSEAGDEYLRAHVSVSVHEEKAEVLITPEKAMAPHEIASVLTAVEVNTLNKARINLLNDCYVLIRQDGQTYGVALGDDHTVKGLTLRG